MPGEQLGGRAQNLLAAFGAPRLVRCAPLSSYGNVFHKIRASEVCQFAKWPLVANMCCAGKPYCNSCYEFISDKLACSLVRKGHFSMGLHSRFLSGEFPQIALLSVWLCQIPKLVCDFATCHAAAGWVLKFDLFAAQVPRLPAIWRLSPDAHLGTVPRCSTQVRGCGFFLQGQNCPRPTPGRTSAVARSRRFEHPARFAFAQRSHPSARLDEPSLKAAASSSEAFCGAPPPTPPSIPMVRRWPRSPNPDSFGPCGTQTTYARPRSSITPGMAILGRYARNAAVRCDSPTSTSGTEFQFANHTTSQDDAFISLAARFCWGFIFPRSSVWGDQF